MFTLLIFILSKNLSATPLQLLVMACLKPTTSIISFYISSTLHAGFHSLPPYIFVNAFIGVVACLCYPFVDNAWYYIASYAIYMIAKRAQEPAWIELLKSNLSLPEMIKTVSRGSSIAYFINICLPIILSFWLEEMWKLLFLGGACLQLMHACCILRLKIAAVEISVRPTQTSLHRAIVDPLRQGWKLLKFNPLFSHYLLLFFLGGAGIVAIQPILPNYFNENLKLSYTQLSLGFSFCKGLSFLCSSPLWAKYAAHISLYRLNVFMNILTCFFIIGMWAASWHVEWLYAGYLCYGAMQGGCELSWNLSGPIFSKKEDSAPYSSLNLILVGIRGCICPILSYFLCMHGGATLVFMVAFCICFVAIFYGLWLDAVRGI